MKNKTSLKRSKKLLPSWFLKLYKLAIKKAGDRAKLARALGHKNSSTLQGWEDGSMPGIDQLEKLIAYLGGNVASLAESQGLGLNWDSVNVPAFLDMFGCPPEGMAVPSSLTVLVVKDVVYEPHYMFGSHLLISKPLGFNLVDRDGVFQSKEGSLVIRRMLKTPDGHIVAIPLKVDDDYVVVDEERSNLVGIVIGLFLDPSGRREEL